MRPFNHMGGRVEFDHDLQLLFTADDFLPGEGFMITHFNSPVPGISSMDVAGFVNQYRGLASVPAVDRRASPTHKIYPKIGIYVRPFLRPALLDLVQAVEHVGIMAW